jgi:hypothetical protein
MKTNNRGSLKLAILAIFTVALFTTTSALAVTWDAGAWKLGLGGNINAFFVEEWASNGSLGSGGTTLTSLGALGDTNRKGDTTNTSSVSNGLLPASLNFSATTNQDGWDIGAHINVYYGIDSAGSGAGRYYNNTYLGSNASVTTGLETSDALKFSTVDARQVYLTFGKKNLGTVKLGRDFGIFAFDAIINDMTLLGVGAPFVASDPGHTTLGGLGYGYIYTDRLAQMDYTTPDWGGFQATAGVFQGFDGNGANSADSPGFHGKVSFGTKAGPVKLYASASGMYQKVVTTANALTNSWYNGGATMTGPSASNNQMYAMDGFVKASVAGLDVLGYYYYAHGMTSLAIGGLVFPGFSARAGSIKAEETDGYMAQVMYTINKVRFGVNWAQSWQTQLYRVRNDKLTLGVYYNLTPSLQLIAEYSNMASRLKTQNGHTNLGTDRAQSADVGAILFF